ncbi:ABC transporter ATP-binding protein [Myxococcota bacterium]|nr:ABC transporter ATP-binding protein [Myxococcota bacterium]MBU1379197.1 ABC transporter ATP-binding protein [Myxococcota bacterium]MBU1496232.1 ABC transporter ATP-binding protein [Myxococcota bacterium]
MELVKVENLKKAYKNFEAVKGISFEIGRGEIFGLIGPNGAGKTTTLRILSTLLSSTSGRVVINGNEVQDKPDEIRKLISYLPEDAGIYKNLRGYEYLQFIANFFKDRGDVNAIVKRGVEIANLGDRINDKVQNFSKGMTRRLVIARALMVQPVLAILDEPTSGLDVVNGTDIRKLIKSSLSEERSVLLSSHNMLEVEYMCDRIALINQGVIVETGTPSELKERYGLPNIEEVFMKIVGEVKHAG